LGTPDSSEKLIAILFVDVVDSSRLYTTYGDAEARRIVGACLKSMGEVVAQHSGTVVKNIGDELMCTFPAPDDAVTAAVVMQQRVSELTRTGSLHSSLSLRIGIHHGEAVCEGGDYFGDDVNLAARMAALSKAHQIMTSRETVDALDGALRPLARFVDRSTIKGQAGMFDLYEIVWDSQEATMAASGANIHVPQNTERVLDVTLGKESQTVNLNNPVVTFGRSEQCDIVVDDVKASRLHARIEFGKNSFVLRDVSTNGTYIKLEDSEPQHVRRGEVALTSSGLFCLGRPVEPDSELCIKFALREDVGRL